MNRTQLYLPKTQLETLRRVAKQKNTTVSGVVRLFISQQLNGNSIQRTKSNISGSLIKIAKQINQLGTKAPSNLSKNIDSYVYGRK